MTYEAKFSRSARKELKKLPKNTQLWVLAGVAGLLVDPRKGNVRPMVGVSSWRLRVGDYRVIYDIIDNKVLIIVIRIRHRKDAYRSR